MADLAWFPFYVDRFLSSRKTRTMTPEQVGIYLLLLCEQWDKGAVPDDLAEIEDITRADRSQASAVLQRCFSLTEHGWQNDAMEDIREEQKAKSERLSEAGRRGGVKSGIARTSKPGLSHAKPGFKRSQAQARLKPGSSIREEEIREEEKREEVRLRTDTHAELSTWLGPHADCLAGVEGITQLSIWGIWGPLGTNAHEWRGIATDRQPPILATAILSWRAGKQSGRFYRPFFAKILERAIDDAISSDRQSEQLSTQQDTANKHRTEARLREEAEIARLNEEARSTGAGRIKIVAGTSTNDLAPLRVGKVGEA